MTARIDETDRRILEYLHKNARATMKEIGEKVHLTGQAVKNRLERLAVFPLTPGRATLCRHLAFHLFQR